MTALTRRALLAATAATAAAHALPAYAAAPHTFKHGVFEVTVVSDGHLVLPTSFLAPNATPDERAALLKAAGQTGETYQSPTNITLVRSGADLILIDMGSGDRFMPTAGKLWDNLKSAGIDKSAITKVIFTHGHPDHLWGAVDELDDLMLPKAAFYVGEAEWNFWNSDDAVRGLPAERAGFVTGARRNYAAIKERVKTLKAGDEIVTGLSLVPTPGHTQGHMAVALAGGDGLIVGGDVLTHPLISFAHPAWRPLADHVPDQAADTRKKLLDRLATDRSRLIAFHLPYPGVGTVERKDGAYRFVAA
ncbi:MAG: MBL fold metallo-hydrolase [Pseudolabrys sp.]|nr:MBL fold metallo-hydrolase [Pseudolabrys sp.]MDP2295684.1 MBL fold metallo-hydrolase [Pseudolabrys sp.]